MPAASPAPSAAAPLLGQLPATFGRPRLQIRSSLHLQCYWDSYQKQFRCWSLQLHREHEGASFAILKPKVAAAGPKAQKAKAGSSRGVPAELSGGIGLAAAAAGSASRYIQADLAILIGILES